MSARWQRRQEHSGTVNPVSRQRETAWLPGATKLMGRGLAFGAPTASVTSALRFTFNKRAEGRGPHVCHGGRRGSRRGAESQRTRVVEVRRVAARDDGEARYAVTTSLSPSSSIAASRILNFCTLPVIVIGNSSTNLT
jgi:hypothetical protein